MAVNDQYPERDHSEVMKTNGTKFPTGQQPWWSTHSFYSSGAGARIVRDGQVEKHRRNFSTLASNVAGRVTAELAISAWEII